MTGKGRSAYTLVELLAVITIIAILIATLLPAVQAARELARRTSCANNVAQLIVAVQNYETLHGALPPGTVNATRPIANAPAGYHHNWLIHILPFLEQRSAYLAIDPHVGVYHPNNRAVRRLDLAVLRCPSRPGSGKAYSDYAGVHNDVEAPIDVDNNGVFFLNSRIRYADVTDGSAYTLFIGEKVTLQGDLGWMSGTRATLRNAGSSINLAPLYGKAAGSEPVAPYPAAYPSGVADEGCRAERYRYAEANVLTDLIKRRDALTAYERELLGVQAKRGHPASPALVVGGFGSAHPRAALFAFGDGSVHNLSMSMDRKVYRHLAHRADGQLAEELW